MYYYETLRTCTCNFHHLYYPMWLFSIQTYLSGSITKTEWFWKSRAISSIIVDVGSTNYYLHSTADWKFPRLWFLILFSESSYDTYCHQCLVLKWLYLHLALQGEPSFHLFGFIMCIGATAARALKTVLQGILLSSEGYWYYFRSMHQLYHLYSP